MPLVWEALVVPHWHRVQEEVELPAQDSQIDPATSKTLDLNVVLQIKHPTIPQTTGSKEYPC